jgi:hypothetical protein
VLSRGSAAVPRRSKLPLLSIQHRTWKGDEDELRECEKHASFFTLVVPRKRAFGGCMGLAGCIRAFIISADDAFLLAA